MPRRRSSRTRRAPGTTPALTGSRRSRSSPRDEQEPPRSPKRTRMDSLPESSPTSGKEESTDRTNVISDEEFTERNTALRTTEKKKEGNQLKPMTVDYKVEDNKEAHHTDGYDDIENLVVRRGQEFSIELTFDRHFDNKKDEIVLQFTVGSRPKQNKNSLIRVRVVSKLTTSEWGMRIDKASGNTVTLTVMSPADAIVGEYSVFVETKTKSAKDGEMLTLRKKQAEKIYLLFNAWCKDDAVFMESEKDCEEYVLNESGNIWVGSARSFSGIPWNFGQFEKVSLEMCLYILNEANMAPPARANPTRVCRVVSKMANSNDEDNGILFGRWTSTYPGNCTRPFDWTGSVAILKEYKETKQCVRYGQCWVFSGLVTTLLRAIGIPTRSVTNFASAHDTDQSMTIDYHFDTQGNPIDMLDSDSVWNFHVWNESYFARRDLPPGYDGWQAHDATPQETSGDVFQCGPCPVKAIKNGEVYLPYDTGFVFAEVNGDQVYWDIHEDGDMTIGDIDPDSIGKYISTKAVGSIERHDLTHDYKYPAGSEAERKAVKLARRFSSRKEVQIYEKSTTNDVKFEIQTSDKLFIGQDGEIKLYVENMSRDTRHVDVSISSKLAFYTGATAEHLKSLREELTLTDRTNVTLVLPVLAKDYQKMAPDASIRCYFKATVKETRQVFARMDVLEFEKPKLEAKFPTGNLKPNEKFQMTFFFTNPLSIKLTNCVLSVECSKMKPNPIKIQLKKKRFNAHEKVEIPVTMEFTKQGRRIVHANFHSDELSGVHGEFRCNVALFS